MKGIGAFLAVVVLVSVGFAGETPPPSKVADHLQEISVTIKAASSEGSGVVKTRQIDGKAVNFVLTAAHVVDGLRRSEEIVDPRTGTKRVKVTFSDASVVKELVEEGRRVGELKMDAAVLRCAKDEDLAVLRILKKDFVKASVSFYQGDTIPVVGTDLYHVGSLLGQMGSNSLTAGIVSQIGRTLDKSEYDQTTCTAFPGSSGGGVFLRDGQYIGMITRGAGEGFNLMIPARRIRKWAATAGVSWILDDKVASPTEAELKKLLIEDTGVTFSGDEPAKKELPRLIRTQKSESVKLPGLPERVR